MQTWGSEGDNRPFLALALGLARRGHRVTLAYTSVENKDYDGVLSSHGVAARRVGRFDDSPDDLRALARAILGKRMPIDQLKLILRHFFDPQVPAMFEAGEALCAENDAVIGHFLLYPLSVAAEKQGRKRISVATIPQIPSREFAPVGLPDLGPLLNPLLWRLADLAVGVLAGGAANGLRRHAGLAPSRQSRMLYDGDYNLAAVSPSLVARPADWPDNAEVGGFLELPARSLGWAMPGSLAEFLEAGPPPVFLGFGSLMSLDPEPERTVSTLMEAASRAGCRAIIQARWSDIRGIPENPGIYRLSYAPHDMILPRCAGVVHHGGAGTTQAAVRCGRPSLVVPHMVDQFFWGDRLYRLGVGVEPLPRRRLNTASLARSLRRLLDDRGLAARAAALGRRMAEEDGVERSADLIERWLEHSRPGGR